MVLALTRETVALVVRWNRSLGRSDLQSRSSVLHHSREVELDREER